MRIAGRASERDRINFDCVVDLTLLGKLTVKLLFFIVFFCVFFNHCFVLS